MKYCDEYVLLSEKNNNKLFLFDLGVHPTANINYLSANIAG